MTQEVQVTLTLAVDTSLSKDNIKNQIEKLINNGTLLSTTYYRMVIPLIKVTDIKEESEIYDNL